MIYHRRIKKRALVGLGLSGGVSSKDKYFLICIYTYFMPAGNLNLKFILYTAFRLSPFIIVCFFSLSSIMNNDLKGIIYLGGLLLACFAAAVLGAWFQRYVAPIPEANEQICNALTLTDTGRVSVIPLSLVVISYTMAYLMDVIVHYKLIIENIATVILFSILIIGEIIWNRTYGCVSSLLLSGAVIFGGLCGIIWARIIRSTGSIKLQYFSGIANSQVCSRPSKQMFRCTPQQKQ